MLRPTLDVRLQHGDTGDWTLRALVDTGALDADIVAALRGFAEVINQRLQFRACGG